MNIKTAFASALFAFLLGPLTVAQAQQEASSTKAVAPDTTLTSAGPAITATTSPLELARIAFAAEGGDKFRTLQCLILSGSAELQTSNTMVPVSGKFIMAVQGRRLRKDFKFPNASMQHIFDGEREYVSLRGIHFPPPDKFGLSALAKFDQPGFTVSALPDKKKQRAFRITDAEGHATDFYLSPETGQILRYIYKYQDLTSSVERERKSLKEVDGVLVPYSFTESFQIAVGSISVTYKVKDVKVNQPLADEVFLIR